MIASPDYYELNCLAAIFVITIDVDWRQCPTVGRKPQHLGELICGATGTPVIGEITHHIFVIPSPTPGTKSVSPSKNCQLSTFSIEDAVSCCSTGLSWPQERCCKRIRNINCRNSPSSSL